MSGDPASLANLREVALPDPVVWWPPTPGWWIVAAALLGLLLLIMRRVMGSYRRNAYRRAAQAELRTLTPGATPTLAALLKRTAIAAYPRARVARLTGAEWVRFLEETGGVSPRVGDMLERSVLRPAHPPSGAEWAELITAARRWIREHRGWPVQ